MSEKVIFPKHFHPRGHESDIDRVVEVRARQIIRLRHIESEINNTPGKKGPSFKVSDALLAAKAIGVLFKRAKENGISIAVLDEECGRTDGRYRINPSIDLSTKTACEKAAINLLVQVRGYLRVAEKIASLIDTDSDVTKIEVLRQTSLWSTNSVTMKTLDDERAWHLALSLKELCAHIIKSEHLSDYFERAKRIPGIWDVAKNSFIRAKGPCYSSSAFEDWFEHWSEAPPLPSVPLVRFLHAEISANLAVEKAGLSDPHTNNVQFTKIYMDKVGRKESRPSEVFCQHEKDEQQFAVTIHLFREIRLAMGPTTHSEELGPMFETRAHIELSTEVGGETKVWPVFPSCTLEHFTDDSIQVLIDGLWRRARVKGDISSILNDHDLTLISKMIQGESVEHPFYWDVSPLSDRKNCVEHYYFSWTPVNESYVSYWLDRPRHVKGNLSIVHNNIQETDGQELWFPSSSCARSVERSLLTGELESALRDQVSELKAKLSQREGEWRDNAAETSKELIGRWSEDVSPHHENDEE